jgi:hypothetical protein
MWSLVWADAAVLIPNNENMRGTNERKTKQNQYMIKKRTTQLTHFSVLVPSLDHGSRKGKK